MDLKNDSTSLRNQTLSYLLKYYPQSLKTIPDDVLEFGLPNRTVTLIYVFFIGLLMAISMTGNSLMMYLYGRHKTLRTPANKLVINLAVANFIMHGKSWILIVNGIDGGPLLGDWGCFMFGGFGTTAGLTEIWTITCIAYERCRAISTPLTLARRLNNTQVNCMILAVWIISLSMAMLPFIGIGGYVTETDLVACVFDTWSRETNDQIFVLLLIISAWLIPILVIFFCYLRIFEYTRGTRATINSHSCTEVHSSATPVSSLKIVTVTDSRKKPFFNSGKAQQEQIERKLAVRLLTIIIIWLVGWTPFASISIVQLLGYGHSVSSNINVAAMMLCKLSSVLNAGLYGMRLPKFRKKIFRLISRFSPLKASSSSVDSSTTQRRHRQFVAFARGNGEAIMLGSKKDVSTGVRFQLRSHTTEKIQMGNNVIRGQHKIETIQILSNNELQVRRIIFTGVETALLCRYPNWGQRRSSL